MPPTATIRLPGPLRERAGGRATITARGATVREMIADYLPSIYSVTAAVL